MTENSENAKGDDVAKYYRNGQKIGLKVGKNMIVGTVRGREGDTYTIETASGKTVNRTVANLFPAAWTGSPAAETDATP